MRNLKPLAGPRPAGSDWAGFCNVQWPLADNPGTIRDLAQYNAATQTTVVVAHRVYTAFGQLVSQTNPSNPSAAAVDCLFGFTGRPFDPATGLQNNLNRWYDPNTGNWLTQDPTGFAAGDTNLYRYCGNSPTNRIDPSGQAWWNLWICDASYAATAWAANLYYGYPTPGHPSPPAPSPPATPTAPAALSGVFAGISGPTAADAAGRATEAVRVAFNTLDACKGDTAAARRMLEGAYEAARLSRNKQAAEFFALALRILPP